MIIITLQELEKFLTKKGYQQFLMGVYNSVLLEKYFKWWCKINTICLLNFRSIVEKYFIIGRSHLRLSFYSITGDRSDIDIFLNRKEIK